MKWPPPVRPRNLIQLVRTHYRFRSGKKEDTMRYVDGYVLAVPKKNLRAYRKIAQKAGDIWKEYGALEYRECAGEDLENECGTPYPRLLKLKRGETAVFAWIVFKSRALATGSTTR